MFSASFFFLIDFQLQKCILFSNQNNPCNGKTNKDIKLSTN